MEINNNVFDNLLEGVYILNTNRIITYWNKAAEKITGHLAEDVIGRGCRDNILVHIDEKGLSLCKSGCPASASMQEIKIKDANVFLHHKDGHRVPVNVRVVPLKDNDGSVIGIMEFFAEDNSNVIDKEKINELVRLSFLDTVTNLTNRRYIELKISNIFNEKQNSKLLYSAIVFDINNFKEIKIEHGNLVSDKVAKMIANTLKSSMKNQVIISRWSEDRYVLLLSEIKKGVLLLLANKLKILLENSFIMNGNDKISIESTLVGTSLKISDSYDVIIRRIEDLLINAKESKKNKFDLD